MLHQPSRASGRSARFTLFLGSDQSPRHFGLQLALGLHVLVDLVAELVRLGGVEVHLLLEDVGEAPRGHAAVVQVLHEDQGVHGGELGCVVHGLHVAILAQRPRSSVD